MAQYYVLAFTLLLCSFHSFFNHQVHAGVPSVRRSLTNFSVDLDKNSKCKDDGCRDSSNNNATLCSPCPTQPIDNHTIAKREADEDAFETFRMWMEPARRSLKSNGKKKVAASGNEVVVSMKDKKNLRAKGRKGKHSKKAKRAGAGDGMAVAAVGNSRAMSYNGDSVLDVTGRRKPSVATSGNGAAYASDGHSYVSSKHGKKSKSKRKHARKPSYRVSDEIMAANSGFLKGIQDKNQDMIANIMSKRPKSRGSAVFVGTDNDRDDAANFDPFKFVGLRDPREMLLG